MAKNSVELLGYYGGDKRVCLSAWQSTTEELGIDLPEKIEDRVDVIFWYLAAQKKKTPWELLNFLAEEHHETPFEKAIVDFQLTGEIASHIHAIKHRISSINAESARYKEFTSDRYYIPEDWADIRCSKAISENWINGILIANKGERWTDILDLYSRIGFTLYHQAVDDIAPVLGKKRAKESARYFLGYNTQINFDWQMNFRSFLNIQQLRNSDHAQKEIHQIANTMLYLVERIPGEPFKGCLAAFELKADLNPEYLLLP